MSSLTKLYVAANAVDAHMLKQLLEQEGIAAVVRGDNFVPLQGGNLFKMETRPSVWVFDDERLHRARELAGEYGRGSPQSDCMTTGWVCRCGEAIEEQFTECWNCGSSKPSGLAR